MSIPFSATGVRWGRIPPAGLPDQRHFDPERAYRSIG